MMTTRVAAAVTAAVLLAACSGGGDDGGGAAADGASAVTIASGDLWFEPTAVSVTAGEVEITLDNREGAVEHDVVIEELDDVEVVHAGPGETDTGTVELAAGTYTFYCSIPGHRSQMEGTIEAS